MFSTRKDNSEPEAGKISNGPAGAASHHAMIFPGDGEDADSSRKVIVRYFLDRAGYGLQQSSGRLWHNPPTTCTATDIAAFCNEQQIKSLNDSSLLIEVYLDRFETYMLLDACDEDGVVFDFGNTSAQNPGILNLRLTDLSSGAAQEKRSIESSVQGYPQNCTTSPVGLFAFSMTVILEAADLLGKLVEGSVASSFILTWGPYAFFVSGLLQLIAGMFEVIRNNVYGATAFMAFGSFWLANGTKLIFLGYFPQDIPDAYLSDSDPVGNFIRNIYIFGLVVVLFKQTLTMNKLTSILIFLLSIQMLATSLSGWSTVMEWIQLVAMFVVSVFAFFLFTAEFTNEVYHRQVFNLYPWTEDSPEQAFAAAGRENTLQAHAAKLRAAHTSRTSTNFHDLRSVLPDANKPKSQ